MLANEMSAILGRLTAAVPLKVADSRTAIGLSAIERECPLREAKIVLYNAIIATRLPRR